MERRHRFTLVLIGDDLATSSGAISEMYEDAKVGTVSGTYFAEFERLWPTFRGALSSAISDVESIETIRVRRVEPDDLLTAAEIADRLGRSRESVRLLASGARGDGQFPPPASHLRVRQRLWRWTDITDWSGGVDSEESERAHYVAAVNAALEYRHHQLNADEFVRTLVGEAMPIGEDSSATSAELEPSPSTPEDDSDASDETPGRFWRRRR
jgi:hypothetical protein